MSFTETRTGGPVSAQAMHGLMLVGLLSAAPNPKPALPLDALVLYENGLGYFERRGQVSAGATAEIPLEPGQLDDALKSLVVMSSKGVASVEFAPPLAAEAARAMAGMPNPEDQRTLGSLLKSLSGVDVKVSADGVSARGRVVDVAEEEDRDKDGKPIPAPVLLFFGEAGLQRVKLKDIESVRPLDPSVQLAWDRAASSSALKPERQQLKVRAGQGGGTIAVGYTTEAPVWRTTYRLVMGKSAPRLQGFALVHNDSDEAWSQVKVTLASGRPASFLFPLAGPRYGRREMVNPEDGLDSSPQLASQEAQEHLRGSHLGVGSLSVTGYGSSGGGYGYGTGTGTLGGRSGSSAVVGSTTPSELLEDGPTALPPAAVSEAGELFLYTVKEKVDLGARKSALLPIIDATAKAEAVSVISAGTVQLAVRLTNDTGLTLEGGTVALFTDGAYAGEAQLDRVKPGEVRVVKHGEDLDLISEANQRRESGPAKKVRLLTRGPRKILELHRVDRVVHTLNLTSRSARPRIVLLELPSTGFRVTSGAEEDVRSPGQPRYARLTLAPKEEKDVELIEEGSFAEKVDVESLTSAQLSAWLAQPVAAEVKAQLSALKVDVEKKEALARKRVELDEAVRVAEAEVIRVRASLESAGKGGAAKAAETLGAKLLALEDKLAALRTEREGLVKSEDAAKKALVAAR